MATTIPAGWGHGAREGVVVEFQLADGSVWVGNFEPGLGGVDDVRAHPSGSQVLVTAGGQLYSVNPTTREVVRLAPGVFGVWELSSPHRVLFNNQDLEFVCVGRSGVAWATSRISWDGFRDLRLDDETLWGEAWSPIEDRWLPFRVNLADGVTVGGSYSGPETTPPHDNLDDAPA